MRYAIIMPEPNEPAQLPKHKVKFKKPLQRACNEKDEKGKLCGGHLKRWFYAADVVEQGCGDVREAYGDHGEVYRCEHCKTLYLPGDEEPFIVNRQIKSHFQQWHKGEPDPYANGDR